MPSFRLIDLAHQLGAELHGNGDTIITAVASIESAKRGDLTFITNAKYREKIEACQASAIILRQSDLKFVNSNALIVKDPYLSYAKAARLIVKTPNPASDIASSAIIDSSVKLGKNVSVGENTVIESNTTLCDNVSIGSGCFIGKYSKIGKNTHIWANVVVYHNVKIGEYCLIHSNAVIGSDGFGYVNDCGNWVKIPQLGGVIIGNQVEIGAGTTVDRGTLDNTIIENGVIIDNLCHIAHNVIVGEHTAIAGGVIMAGSLKIGRHCMIGGASVINGHIEICDHVSITGMSMVIRSITEPGIYSSGIPIQPNKIWRKTTTLVMNINEIHKRLKKIENKIDQKK